MSLTFLILLVAGQNKNTLRGKVTDKSNQQPIAGAIVSGDGSQTSTNENGGFFIS